MPVQGAGWTGDYAEDYATLNLKFTTLTTSWVPVALLGTPIISIYTGSATGTEVTTGVTLAVDFDGVTGLNNVLIDLSSAAFYAVAADYHVIITQGTIDSVSAVGVVVGSFSIENRKSKADVIEWLGTAVGAGTAGVPNVDMTRLSNDAAAADNLELMFDGTGYTDDTAPASRLQVAGIGAASGGALNFANEADNVDTAIKTISFDGVETSGTNASVNAEDATYHQIDDSSNNIDIVYQFDVGGGRTAVEVTWKGRLTGNNDVATIQAYNGTSFDTVFTISGNSNSAPSEVADNAIAVIPLLGTHTGTGSDIGKVFIRIECAAQSNPTLYTDQLLVSAVSIGQTVGYALGSVWIDTDDGVAGTENFVNGVADNPSLSLADALTISASVKLHRYICTPDSSITFTNTRTNEIWQGEGTVMALGGRDVGGTHFMGMDISGICSGAEVHFDHCEIGDVTVASAHFDECDIEGTVICDAAANYQFVGCAHSGTAATIDFGTASSVSTTVHMHGYHGALTVKNMGQSGTDVLHWSSGDGKLTLDSTCVGGTVNMNGTFDFVNSGSNMTLNRDGDSINTIDTLLTTAVTESYASDGSAPTVVQSLMMIQQILGDFAISGTTLTVKKVDGSTTAATYTLDDSASPTSLTRAS